MPQSWEFVDIYGLDPDLLGMVPQPVKAVVLLYPINEKVLNLISITFSSCPGEEFQQLANGLKIVPASFI